MSILTLRGPQPRRRLTTRVLGLALLLNAAWCLRLDAQLPECGGEGAIRGTSPISWYSSTEWLGADHQPLVSRPVAEPTNGDGKTHSVGGYGELVVFRRQAALSPTPSIQSSKSICVVCSLP